MLKRIKNTRLNAQITVYASLSILLVISLIVTCFRSTVLSYEKAHADAACSLSLESVFAGYSNKMLEEYDLFVRNSDTVELVYGTYLDGNLSDWGENSIISYSIMDKVYMTDDNGVYLENQIMDYMKYGLTDEILSQITGTSAQQEQGQVVHEMNELVANVEEAEIERDQLLLRLIGQVEGLQVNDNGIVVSNGKPVASNDLFVKMLLYGQVSMEHTGISDSRVYAAMTSSGPTYIDLSESIHDMVQLVADLEEVSKEAYEEYKSAYEQERTELIGRLESTYAAIDDALSTINAYKNQLTVIQEVCQTCLDKVSASANTLSQNVTSEISEGIQSIASESDHSEVCDIDQMETELVQYKQNLDQAIQVLQSHSSIQLTEQSVVIKEELNSLLDQLSDTDFSHLMFHYDSFDFSSEQEGLSGIKQIYQTISNGISGLVLDGVTPSNKEIADLDLAYVLYQDSAENQIDQSYKSQSQMALEHQEAAAGLGLTDTIYQRGIFNEYLFLKFSSFTDYLTENGGLEKDDTKQLEYMIEFILGDHNGDLENLNQVMLELSLIREGINFTYLITDAQKRNEAYVLAQSLVGFSGNLAVIKAAQYLILSVWAYGESILDLRMLYQGEKVPLIKNQQNWKLSLSNLLQLNFEISHSSSETEQGVNYEQYLRMLLLVENQSKRNYRTMSAMELRMIELGNAEFRMSHYIVGMTVNTDFNLSLLAGTYNRANVFGY